MNNDGRGAAGGRMRGCKAHAFDWAELVALLKQGETYLGTDEHEKKCCSAIRYMSLPWRLLSSLARLDCLFGLELI